MRELVVPPASLIKTCDIEDVTNCLNQAVKEDRQIALEIGCGVGLHPIQWAKENPNGRILAFERTSEKFEKFKKRLSHHPELTNIYAVHGDAAIVLPNLQIKNIFDEIYILYPNPYPKHRHKNLRFAYSPFTAYLKSLLKTDGRLIFATNIESYAQELENELPKNFDFLPPKVTPILDNSPPRSHFEKKYLKRGDCCWNVVFSP